MQYGAKIYTYIQECAQRFQFNKRENFNASLSLSLTELIIDRDIKFFFLSSAFDDAIKYPTGKKTSCVRTRNTSRKKKELELENDCIRANLTITHSMNNHNNGQ